MGQVMKGGGIDRTRPTSVRFRYLFLLATVFGGSFLIITINNSAENLFLNNEALDLSWDSQQYEVIDFDDSFTIKTEGCTIPGLQPFDKRITKFIENPGKKHIKACHNAETSLLENNDTHIWIKKEMLHNFNIFKDDNISCCYQPFYRPTAIADISSEHVDDRVEYEGCIDFTNYIKVAHEFVKVSCYSGQKSIYEQFFLFAPSKPFLTYREDTIEMTQNQSVYNVIVMGIDAISRLNFHRTMPKTLTYLKKKGVIELLGYNKVGDNTFPNLTPMLLGIKETELKRTCWPNSKSTFDNCPFIWEWFKDAGYFTALGEDSASLGTFNFEKFGFSGTPTDYYIHTFMHEAELHAGNNRDFNSYLCMGNKYFFQVLLDYIKSLASTLKISKLFGFFWEVTMSHDFLNYPMMMDDSYLKFLKTLDSFNYLNDTILILISDHGIRWGDIRFTKQGRLEERLPLMQILLPPSFRENYSLAYDNLKSNSRRLTTPFDVYATLYDLVNLDVIKNEKIKIRSESPYSKERSISLFLSIPRNRTCKSAGIDDHWCTCHRNRKLSRKSREAHEASTHLVEYLNTLVSRHPQCAQLSLSKVMEVTEMMVGSPSAHEVGWREFMVVVRTSPGRGVFEATLRHDSNQWSLSGTISRLNLYGDQSRCMHHYQLKLYCYCQ